MADGGHYYNGKKPRFQHEPLVLCAFCTIFFSDPGDFIVRRVVSNAGYVIPGGTIRCRPSG